MFMLSFQQFGPFGVISGQLSVVMDLPGRGEGEIGAIMRNFKSFQTISNFPEEIKKSPKKSTTKSKKGTQQTQTPQRRKPQKPRITGLRPPPLLRGARHGQKSPGGSSETGASRAGGCTAGPVRRRCWGCRSSRRPPPAPPPPPLRPPRPPRPAWRPRRGLPGRRGAHQRRRVQGRAWAWQHGTDRSVSMKQKIFLPRSSAAGSVDGCVLY